MQKSDWIAVISFSIILQMLSFWCIDTSVSALISGGTVVNAFMTMNPCFTYHLGVAVSIINFMFLVFITVHHILREKLKKKEKTVKKKKEEPKEEVSK